MRVELSQDPDLPNVHADVGHVEQALLNLVSNAVDALRGEGRLVLGATLLRLELVEARRRGLDPGEFVAFSVVDDGPGMPEHVLERMFDPFFTTKPEGTGTGLGLASASEIARQHRGYMTASSEIGVRTVVSLVLPVSEALTPGPLRAANGSQGRSWSGVATVLLVDDDAVVRSTMARVLRRAGLQVVDAHDGASALETWERCKDEVDVIVTDLVMSPGMGGRELGEELERRGCTVPVLYVSGYSSEFSYSDLLQPGRNFLQKPFEGAAFVAFVTSAITALVE